LIRPFARFSSVRFAVIGALVALSLPLFQASAQQDAPAAPAQEPSAPTPTAAPAFPKPDPANFTANSPSKEVVNAFLQASWGYDDTRAWEVWAILKTQVEGISKVVVLVATRAASRSPRWRSFMPCLTASTSLSAKTSFPLASIPMPKPAPWPNSAPAALPGFGLQGLELVEFADFQCPHCKDAQANMEKLAVDFPKARIVFRITRCLSILKRHTPRPMACA